MTTTTILAITSSAAVLLFALFAGIPLWLVIRHPDQRSRPVLAVQRQRRARAASPSPAWRAAPAWNTDRFRLTDR